MTTSIVDQLCKKANAAIRTGDRFTNNAGKHYIQAGKFLLQAKAKVKADGGDWLPHLKKHNIVERTAQHYMALAEGKTTIEEVREKIKESTQKSRAKSAIRIADSKPDTKPPAKAKKAKPATEAKPVAEAKPTAEAKPIKNKSSLEKARDTYLEIVTRFSKSKRVDEMFVLFEALSLRTNDFGDAMTIDFGAGSENQLPN